MSLSSWWVDFKLGRVDRKLKAVHVRQRQVRDKLQELERAHRRGKLAPADFDAQAGKLREEKHALTERVNALNAEAAELKRARRGVTA